MEIEAVKNLIKKYAVAHTDHLQRTEVARRYYRNETDIMIGPPKKEQEAEKGEPENPLRNADNRVPFNFHGLLVNQKAAYMFTAPPIFDVGSDAANKTLRMFFGDKYPKVCKDLCVEASNAAVGWIHVWKDGKTGTYNYAIVPSEQVIPVWDKSLEKKLLGVLRCYQDLTDDGEVMDVYEFWNDKTCEAYAVRAGYTIEEGLFRYREFTIINVYGNSEASDTFTHDIGEVPFFAFANNNIGTDDLKNIKPLIDTYCKVFSGFVNDLEDIQEIIFVLTNYGGADLREFLQDMKNYKAIKIDNDGSGDSSGVSTLTIELPVEAREKLMTVTRKCIFEQGMGIDPDPQNFGNSSGVALNFLYSLLELKAGLLETEFRPSFGRFIRCVCRLLNLPIKDDTIIQTWTRTSVRNDQETAQIAAQSKGIVSDKTIVRNHPWVEDPEKEMQQLQEQEAEAQETIETYQDAFRQAGGVEDGKEQ